MLLKMGSIVVIIIWNININIDIGIHLFLEWNMTYIFKITISYQY